jgi:hypothetical protein
LGKEDKAARAPPAPAGAALPPDGRGTRRDGSHGWGLLRTGPRDGRTGSVRGPGPTGLWIFREFLLAPRAVVFLRAARQAPQQTGGDPARVVEEWGPPAGARVTSRLTKHGATVHNSD